MRIVMLVLAALALAIAAPAVADKGGNPNGGKGTGNPSDNTNGNGNGNRSAATLVATPNVLRAGDVFDVSGCGYDLEYGNVIVGFTGGSWGSPLDSQGCFTIPGIPALSGDTLPPGTYTVTAFQYVSGKLRATGETTVTVVE